MNNNLVFFILGPTCSGKTNLSIDLCEYFPFEVINCDSTMFYKHMDIGTGKPSLDIRKKIIHHLIDIIDPVEWYSVWNFCVDAIRLIFNCWSRFKIPLLVGGTMMYAWYFQNFFYFFKKKYLLNNMFLNKQSNFELTDFSLRVYRDLFSAFLYFDSKSVYFNIINIFLLPFDKDIFYCKIKDRIFYMLKNGFLEEVYFLYSRKDLTFDTKSMKAIGYKDIWMYLDNKISFSMALDSILSSTIDLSNRQLKWVKKFNNNSFYIENKKNFYLKDVVKILNDYCD